MTSTHLIPLDQGRLVGIGIAENASPFSLRGCRPHRFTLLVDFAPEQRRHWRTQMLERRQALSPRERIEAAQNLCRHLESLPEFMVDHNVAGYWATGGELPLNLAQAGLARRGQRWHLPVIGADRVLRFAPWAAGDAVTANRYGIPEPEVAAEALHPAEAMALVLVPLLGFDRFGQRIGFGGGFYDRSFAFLSGRDRPADPLLVGVGYAFQELDAIMPQPWDVRLDFVATDRELIDCNALSDSH